MTAGSPRRRPSSTPWDLTLEKPPADVMNGFKWELYNIDEDWTQANDLAAKMPDKLRDMQQLFMLGGREVPACSRSTTLA